MDDPNSVPRDFFFDVFSSYVGSCLFTMCSLFAAWLTPRVLSAARWLHARLRSRRDVTIQLTDLHAKFTQGPLSASVSRPELPPGTAGALAMAAQPPVVRPVFVAADSTIQGSPAALLGVALGLTASGNALLPPGAAYRA